MDFIISDVHGCLNTLISLVEDILEIDSNPTLVFVGDYIDRGPFSKQVVDYLIKLNNKYKCIFLRGNHDDVFCKLLNNSSLTNYSEFNGIDNDIDLIQWFANHGLLDTTESFGIKSNLNTIIKDIKNIDPIYKDFFNNLLPYYVGEDYFCTHGFFPLEKKIEELKDVSYEILSWNRFYKENFNENTNWDRIGIFGHTPTRIYTGEDNIIKNSKIILLDGCIFKNGRINAYCPKRDISLFRNRSFKDVFNC